MPSGKNNGQIYIMRVQYPYEGNSQHNGTSVNITTQLSTLKCDSVSADPLILYILLSKYMVVLLQTFINLSATVIISLMVIFKTRDKLYH